MEFRHSSKIRHISRPLSCTTAIRSNVIVLSSKRPGVLKIERVICSTRPERKSYKRRFITTTDIYEYRKRLNRKNDLEIFGFRVTPPEESGDNDRAQRVSLVCHIELNGYGKRVSTEKHAGIQSVTTIRSRFRTGYFRVTPPCKSAAFLARNKCTMTICFPESTVRPRSIHNTAINKQTHLYLCTPRIVCIRYVAYAHAGRIRSFVMPTR